VAVSPSGERASPHTTALRGATLIDGTGADPRSGATVVLEGDRIIAVGTGRPPAGSRVLDLGGRTLIPGLFNCHVHLQLDAGPTPLVALEDESPDVTRVRARERAARMLRAGVTTVRDCGARDWQVIELRRSVDEGIVSGPRILACGRALCLAGGHAQVVGEPVKVVDDVPGAVRRQIEAGADFIKAMATGGFGKAGERLDHSELDLEQLAAAADAAHAAGRRLTVHAYGTRGIRDAIAAGADSVEHATFLDDEVLRLLKERGIFIVPTLTNTYRVATEGAKGGVPPYIIASAAAALPAMLANAGRAWRAGARMALGTDAGSWINPHDDIATELRLRVQVGVPPLAALTMATRWSAECLGIADRVGTLEPGKLADVVVLDGDPLTDLSALERVQAVFKGGELVHSVDGALAEEAS
jgi:imidazolonepropionase-like amidohydrolase